MFVVNSSMGLRSFGEGQPSLNSCCCGVNLLFQRRLLRRCLPGLVLPGPGRPATHRASPRRRLARASASAQRFAVSAPPATAAESSSGFSAAPAWACSSCRRTARRSRCSRPASRPSGTDRASRQASCTAVAITVGIGLRPTSGRCGQPFQRAAVLARAVTGRRTATTSSSRDCRSGRRIVPADRSHISNDHGKQHGPRLRADTDRQPRHRIVGPTAYYELSPATYSVL